MTGLRRAILCVELKMLIGITIMVASVAFYSVFDNDMISCLAAIAGLGILYMGILVRTNWT